MARAPATQFQIAEDKSRDWENKEPHTVREDQVQDLLRNLKVHKSMGPDKMNPQVMRELADEVANHCPPYLRSDGSAVKFQLTGNGEK